jgi:hypothetical protein
VLEFKLILFVAGETEKSQLNSQVLYAPFVQPKDKVRKDITDMSLSDFEPKRLALAYDPPTIVLEYLV